MSLISKGWKSRWLQPREFGELTHGRSNSASPGQGGEQIMAVDSFLAPYHIAACGDRYTYRGYPLTLGDVLEFL